VLESYPKIQETIQNACSRARRDPAGVRLLAVTKTVPLAQIQEAVASGIQWFGESRIQEAEKKIHQVGPAHWHLIGPLQSNKINKALELFEMIESLDRLELADALQKRAAVLGKTVRCLMEINIGGEAGKHGFAPDEVEALTPQLKQYPNLEVRGLMTVAPYADDPEQARPFFRRMKELFEGLKHFQSERFSMETLSMGMSHDYAVAVEEGSTEVRIGSALFGVRA